jgi:hypothetical protein
MLMLVTGTFQTKQEQQGHSKATALSCFVKQQQLRSATACDLGRSICLAEEAQAWYLETRNGAGQRGETHVYEVVQAQLLEATSELAQQELGQRLGRRP